MIGQLLFDELTPEEKVRQSEREKRRLAAKAQEEAIEGNKSNKNNLKKIDPQVIGAQYRLLIKHKDLSFWNISKIMLFLYIFTYYTYI